MRPHHHVPLREGRAAALSARGIRGDRVARGVARAPVQKPRATKRGTHVPRLSHACPTPVPRGTDSYAGGLGRGPWATKAAIDSDETLTLIRCGTSSPQTRPRPSASRD